MEVIGILGGMGPAATAELFQRMIRFTDAKCDQDHASILIYNHPQIPDRSEAILSNGPSPLPQMIEGAQCLEKAGASMVVMPCNTAHYFYKEISDAISIPFIHMPQETVKYIQKNFPNVKKVGLLATSATIQSTIYHSIFTEHEVLVPLNKEQESVMNAIFTERGVKAGKEELPRILLDPVCDHLAQQGAQAIIAGCTEISLILKQYAAGLPVIDPLNILAISALNKTSVRVKKNIQTQ